MSGRLREVKFRAWDKKIKQMCDVGEIHYCYGGLKVFGTGVHLSNGWVTEFNNCKHDCDVALMQYTGLKDKNGKEIYEGDILLILDSEIAPITDYGKGPLEPCNHLSEVIFKNGCFGANITEDRGAWSKDFYCFNVNLDDFDGVEVIGNIYENPELLEREDICRN